MLILAWSAAKARERVIMDLPLPPPRAGASPVGHTLPTAVERTATDSAASPAPGVVKGPNQEGIAPVPSTRGLHLVLNKGESVFQLLSRHGVSQGDLVTMVRGNRRIKRSMRRLRPGQHISVHVTASGAIERLLLARPGPKDLLIERNKAGTFSMREVADDPSASDLAILTAMASPAAMSAPGEGAQAAGSFEAPKENPADRKTNTPRARTAESPTVDPASVSDGAAAAPSAPAVQALEAPVTQSPARVVTIRPGDSLYAIFRRIGVSPQDLARLLDAGKESRRLRSLRPGQTLTVALGPDRRLESLAIDLNEEQSLKATRSGASYSLELKHHPLERRLTTASAVIENSLFLAGQREGLSDRIIMELTEIFGWDVDFALDVRAGDRFTVIYEELFKNGKKLRDGPILASEFFNRGRSVRAIRYVDEHGRSEYFSPDGLSMRKAFLRTPVNFSRISSRFSAGRLHPVLQRMRAHKGVDYAARRGTPIKVTGDGRVILAGRKGGYGKTVIVQHGATYTTLYAHMSRIHRRARRGNRVRQGDIIGYVGSTGLATGPHLHYEFRVRGVHADPLRVKLPKALPIEARYKQDFVRKSFPLVTQLDVLANTSLASSN